MSEDLETAYEYFSKVTGDDNVTIYYGIEEGPKFNYKGVGIDMFYFTGLSVEDGRKFINERYIEYHTTEKNYYAKKVKEHEEAIKNYKPL